MVLGGILLIGQPTMAVPSFDLNKVTLNIEAEANEATRGLLTYYPGMGLGLAKTGSE